MIRRAIRSLAGSLPPTAIAVMVPLLIAGAGSVDATGLVLHLPLDDGPGSTVALDASGNGHHGALINMDAMSDWVAGQAGIALDFDGVNDYVSVPDHADLDFGAGDFSVAVWVFKRSPTVGYDNCYAVAKWSTGAAPGTNEWCLLVGSGMATGDMASFAVEIGFDKYKVIDPAEISLDTWHHVVGVRKGDRIALYVDGVLVDVDSSLPPGGAVNNVGSELRIAANQPAAPIYFTDAIFDDVQIYGFALSDGGVAVGEPAGGDIASLYSNPGMSIAVFVDGFESGDTSEWSLSVP